MSSRRPKPGGCPVRKLVAQPAIDHRGQHEAQRHAEDAVDLPAAPIDRPVRLRAADDIAGELVGRADREDAPADLALGRVLRRGEIADDVVIGESRAPRDGRAEGAAKAVLAGARRGTELRDEITEHAMLLRKSPASASGFTAATARTAQK